MESLKKQTNKTFSLQEFLAFHGAPASPQRKVCAGRARGAPINNSEVLMTSHHPGAMGEKRKETTLPGRGPANCRVFTDSRAS